MSRTCMIAIRQLRARSFVWAPHRSSASSADDPREPAAPHRSRPSRATHAHSGRRNRGRVRVPTSYRVAAFLAALALSAVLWLLLLEGGLIHPVPSTGGIITGAAWTLAAVFALSTIAHLAYQHVVERREVAVLTAALRVLRQRGPSASGPTPGRPTAGRPVLRSRRFLPAACRRRRVNAALDAPRTQAARSPGGSSGVVSRGHHVRSYLPRSDPEYRNADSASVADITCEGPPK